MVPIHKLFRKIIQGKSRCLRCYSLLQQLSLELERGLFILKGNDLKMTFLLYFVVFGFGLRYLA